MVAVDLPRARPWAIRTRSASLRRWPRPTRPEQALPDRLWEHRPENRADAADAVSMV